MRQVDDHARVEAMQDVLPNSDWLTLLPIEWHATLRIVDIRKRRFWCSAEHAMLVNRCDQWQRVPRCLGHTCVNARVRGGNPFRCFVRSVLGRDGRARNKDAQPTNFPRVAGPSDTTPEAARE